MDCRRTARMDAIAKLVFYVCVVVFCLLYIFVVANTPIAVLATAGFDDGLYMKLGRSIAQGDWLGRYDQYTLVKGPGYPLFLALANWLGLSATVAQALFHCTAVIFFATICRQFVRSYLMAAVLVLLLIWEPVTYTTPELLRILRDEMYSDQILIVVGAMTWAFFGASAAKDRILYAGFSGAVLGWLWLTREESVWVLPALLLLALAALVIGFRQHRWREVVLSIGAIAFFWLAVETGYRSINMVVYNSFAGVELGETNFRRALSALHSVTSGGKAPFVSVTREARRRIYPFSPAFAALAPYIDGEGGKAWERWSCEAMPISCGEIGSGWFSVALRDAVAAIGGYSSPLHASDFYGRLADEISIACANGSLACKRQVIAEIPDLRWPQVAQVPHRLWRALTVVLHNSPTLDARPSSGDRELLDTSLRFLNYPLHTKSADVPAYFLMHGWYYKTDLDWFSIAIKSPRRGEFVELERTGSPDLVIHFHDPEASHQRFTTQIACFADCVLRLSTNAGFVEKRLFEFLNPPLMLDVGGGSFYLDLVTSTDQAAPSRAQLLAKVIRSAARDAYDAVGVPVFIVGAVPLVATVALFWKQVPSNICFIVALVCWALAGSRALILALVDATIMQPMLNFQYLAPAKFLAMSATVLSFGAAIHAFGRYRPFAKASPKPMLNGDNGRAENHHRLAVIEKQPARR
jgi:hypothetical protein